VQAKETEGKLADCKFNEDLEWEGDITGE